MILVSLVTYLGQYARNKTIVKLLRGNKESSKKADFMSNELSITSTSAKDVSQIRVCDESYVFSTYFGPVEITQDEIKQVVEEGEFINFKILFLHNYYAYKNTKFPA